MSKTRHNFELDPDLINHLVGATNASSMSEVVRNALSVYQFVVDRKNNGFELELVKGEERQRIHLL